MSIPCTARSSAPGAATTASRTDPAFRSSASRSSRARACPCRCTIIVQSIGSWCPARRASRAARRFSCSRRTSPPTFRSASSIASRTRGRSRCTSSRCSRARISERTISCGWRIATAGRALPPEPMTNLNSFKAYDIRGRIPDEINDSLAYDIGRAYAAFVKPRKVAVGYDIRLSSPQLAAALKRGLIDSGVDALDIGLWGTEGAYFATFADKLDGGITVTASHNPPDYNGMKLVREHARPISADTGLLEMRALIESGQLPPKAAKPGTERSLDIRGKYLDHLLGYVNQAKLHKLKVVV